MKTRIPRWLRETMLLLILMMTTPPAQAYYDPGIQRWINRDPRGESGFEGARRQFASERTGLAHRPVQSVMKSGPYAYLDNSPLGAFDAFGLQASGSADQETMAECWTDCMKTLVPYPLKVLGCFSGLGALGAKVAGAATVSEVLLILPVWASGSGVGCFLGCFVLLNPGEPLPTM